MLSIFKNFGLSSIIKTVVALVIFTLIAIIFSLNAANASLSKDNKVLTANAQILKTANNESVATIAELMHQLKQNEQIAYKRSVIVNDIAKDNIEVKQVLVEVIKESDDENIIEWSDALVPDDIVSVLKHPRNSNSDENSKINTTKSVNGTNLLASIPRQNKSRSSQLYF